MAKDHKEATIKVAGIQKKVDELTRDLPEIDKKVVKTPQLEKIIEELKKLAKEIAEEKGKIDALDAEMKKKEQEMLDFAKKYRGDQLYESDRKLKDAEAELADLEKRLREVGALNDNLQEEVKGAAVDPKDKERVALAQRILGETEKCGSEMGNMKKQKNDIRKIFNGIKENLRSKNASDVTAAEVAELMKDIDKCGAKVKGFLGDLDGIEVRLKKLRSEWNSSKNAAQEKERLSKEFKRLLSDNSELYEKLVQKLTKQDEQLGGLETLNKSMAASADYAT